MRPVESSSAACWRSPRRRAGRRPSRPSRRRPRPVPPPPAVSPGGESEARGLLVPRRTRHRRGAAPASCSPAPASSTCPPPPIPPVPPSMGCARHRRGRGRRPAAPDARSAGAAGLPEQPDAGAGQGPGGDGLRHGDPGRALAEPEHQLLRHVDRHGRHAPACTRAASSASGSSPPASGGSTAPRFLEQTKAGQWEAMAVEYRVLNDIRHPLLPHARPPGDRRGPGGAGAERRGHGRHRPRELQPRHRQSSASCTRPTPPCRPSG